MSLPIELNFSGRPRLPLIQSAEGAECGLACMAMVASYLGHDVDLNGLRQRFPISMAGATLAGLMTIGEHLDLSTRALRVELDDLPRLRTPAILHWDLNHFVVLKSVRKGRAIIHDPARGRREYSLEELSKHFTGVALELSPAAGFEPVRARESISLTNLWSRMVGFWPAVFQILVLSVALQIVTFAMPFQMQLVVDEAIFRADGDLLVVLALAFGSLIIIQAAIEAVRSWALQVFGSLLTFQMVGNIVRHLLRLPSDYFEKRHVGDILSRIGSASAIQQVLTRGVISTVIDGVMAIVAVVILFVYSSTLALVVIAAVLLNLILSLAMFPALRARTEEQIVEQAREQSHLMETVRAAVTIKVMGQEAQRESQWRNLYGGVINTSVTLGRLNISLGFLQSIISGLQTVIVIYLGARSVIAGDGFSVGMLFAFLSFRQTFTDRAGALIGQIIQFRFLSLHLDRLADIVTTEPDRITGVPPAVEIKGRIEVSELSFRYGATDPLVLDGLDLNIAPGEFVAITGPSGGGKTTLTKLLLGLREPTAGSIRLDGHAATPELWRAWRARVGLVAQDDRLLSGSIADNIAFFDPDLDMAKVYAAAYAAQVHDQIMQMPMQYQSLIGDMGSTLSGGQKQRVLLARALYRQPAILILDEGTANLDVETEETIAELLSQMGITRIVVAHRPALLNRAGRVLSLTDGRLVEVSRNKGAGAPAEG